MTHDTSRGQSPLPTLLWLRRGGGGGVLVAWDVIRKRSGERNGGLRKTLRTARSRGSVCGSF